MKNTDALYQARKHEINLYFDFIKANYEQMNDKNRFNFNQTEKIELLSILYSNFFIMLYSLIEACIRQGLTEIYDSISDCCKNYVELSEPIKLIFIENTFLASLKSKVNNKNSNTNNNKVAVEYVRELLENVYRKKNLPEKIYPPKFQGNLNYEVIKKLLEMHGMHLPLAFQSQSLNITKPVLDNIKNVRNSLSHGDESFASVARTNSISDIENIKNNVLDIVENILKAMEDYDNLKSYMQKQPEK